MININMDKAKDITHAQRRIVRDELFKPLDIQATIPMFAKDAEVQRQAIRDKFDILQADIDAAQTPEELKEIITLFREENR